ncbi:FG-GAP repeat domain-containing protein [Marinibactrum halimedae]|uniref:VCBS repeat-containing protein n=1 Tax=Marinibactrum halimedae TaxID=1444977 RepID=A0AA37WNF6_9GAMM|nr:VCBS repeat-containing protein [Marinibactrum halimedae]MCD9460218.1 VCBS repeat-containing protein [Marinibactrum halimedae]GLS27949.1 hypothetical protein GCM10007877_36680 [Marinibactrum halimedae]
MNKQKCFDTFSLSVAAVISITLSVSVNAQVINKVELDGRYSSGAAIADIDGDGDLDLIIAGRKDELHSDTIVYKNNGSGTFTANASENIPVTWFATIEAEDLNNDGLIDVFMSARSIRFRSIINAFLGDGEGEFTAQDNRFIRLPTASKMRLGDYDGDGDFDVLVFGIYGFPDRRTQLYENDGSGKYSLVTDSFFDGVNGDALFGDFDSDGDEDILLAGLRALGASADDIVGQFYENRMGRYSVENERAFEPVSFAVMDSGDIDGDGDLDIVVSGLDINNNHTTVLYTNDGLGNFRRVFNGNIAQLVYGDVTFADVDNDDDLDLLQMGRNERGASQTFLYLNNGRGIFTPYNRVSFEGLERGTIDVADINGNGTPDVLFTGINNRDRAKSTIYFDVME